MVRRVMEGISPTVLAEEIGVTPGTIRAWVKAAGHTLPKSYTTKGKVARKTEQQGAAANASAVQQQQQQQQPPQLHIPDQVPGQTLRPPVPGQPGQRPQLQQQQQQPRFVNRTVGTQQVRPVLMQPQQQQQQQQAGKVVTADASSLNDPTPPSGMPGAGPARLKKPGSTYEPYQPKRVPGYLAVCKNCGCIGSDFNKCESCKRPIPEDCKRVPDKNSKRVIESMSSLTVTTMGGDLRNVRIHSKTRKKKPDEPECIAISSDEDEDDEEEEEEGEEADKSSESAGDKKEGQQQDDKAASSNSAEGGKEGAAATTEGKKSEAQKVEGKTKQTEKGETSKNRLFTIGKCT